MRAATIAADGYVASRTARILFMLLALACRSGDLICAEQITGAGLIWDQEREMYLGRVIFGTARGGTGQAAATRVATLKAGED